MLVTIPEQTLVDLVARPRLGGMASEADAAAHHLSSRVDLHLAVQLAAKQKRAAPLAKFLHTAWDATQIVLPGRRRRHRPGAGHFRGGEAQVRRDFAISWMLWAIAESTPDVVFLGGTALSRTLLTGLRLSEDIDLMPIGPRSQMAAARGN